MIYEICLLKLRREERKEREENVPDSHSRLILPHAQRLPGTKCPKGVSIGLAAQESRVAIR